MKKVFLTVAVAFTIFSCNKDQPQSSFDRGLILRNISANLIIPAYQDFASKAGALDTKVQAFVSSPSGTTLTAAQESWVAAKLSWKRTEAFNFGPVEDFGIENKIDLWPTNTSGLQNAIAAYDDSDDYLVSTGSDKKGLPAIEYLLFSASEESTLTSFNEAKRGAYLELLSADLVSQIEFIQNEWESFQSEFDENTGEKVTSSITVLGNEIIFLLEEVKNIKVGYPGGIVTTSEIVPSHLECYYSQSSLEMIEANLEIIEEIYSGVDGIGFDDYLNDLNIQKDDQLLSETIADAFSSCYQALANVEAPVEENLEADIVDMRRLYDELQKLTVLLKIDMMSSLDLIVTFSDADGD